VKGTNVSTDFKGEVVNSFKQKGETPKAIAVMQWYTKDLPLTLENDVKADMVGQILDMVYTKKIREDASAAYTVFTMANMSRNDFETTAQILIYCPMKPEKGDTAIMIMRDEVAAMAKTCDADKLQKVKEYMLKSHADQMKQNGYWQGCINQWRKWGIDFHTDYEKVVNAQTPESISAFMTELLKAGNRAEVIMMPAEE
jgi:zinc protease